MQLLKKRALLSCFLAITTFSSSVFAHTFTYKEPNNKDIRNFLIVSIYSTDFFSMIPRKVFYVTANNPVSYVEENDGPIRVQVRTSMTGGWCEDFGCSPHGMYGVDLDAGENMTCEIKENAGMLENNLICHRQ